MPLTDAELRTAETAYRAALGHSGVKRTLRDSLVHRAIADGWTHARIAAAIDPDSQSPEDMLYALRAMVPVVS